MKFYIFIILTCLIITVVESRSELYDSQTDLTDDEIFDQFNQKFKVPFRRRLDFSEVKRTLGNRYRSVQEQNSRYSYGLESFNRTLYPFSYMADEDFAEYFLGAEDPDPKTKALNLINSTNDDRNGRMLEPPATKFAWPESITGPVKNQGSCGSCYAFAAIGVIKSRMAVKYGKMLYDLSEQDAMECTRGCRGGWDYSVYRDYAQRFGGCAAYNYQKLHSYSAIAYACQASSRPRVPSSNILEYGYLQNNEEVIMRHLYNYGPLYTRFNVYSNFYDYQSGIYDRLSGSYLGGHAVILTGYGVENGKKFWILKNSWDSWWGENGYFRMIRGINLGGIEASVSVVKDLK